MWGKRNCLSFETAVGGIEPPSPRLTVRRSTVRPPLLTYKVSAVLVAGVFLGYRDNILGKGGEIAEEFAVLVKALWSGQYRSIAPRDFKVSK